MAIFCEILPYLIKFVFLSDPLNSSLERKKEPVSLFVAQTLKVLRKRNKKKITKQKCEEK